MVAPFHGAAQGIQVFRLLYPFSDTWDSLIFYMFSVCWVRNGIWLFKCSFHWLPVKLNILKICVPVIRSSWSRLFANFASFLKLCSSLKLFDVFSIKLLFSELKIFSSRLFFMCFFLTNRNFNVELIFPLMFFFYAFLMTLYTTLSFTHTHAFLRGTKNFRLYILVDTPYGTYLYIFL